MIYRLGMFSKERVFDFGVHTKVSGLFKLEVIHPATGDVIRSTPWQKNLVLNGGLDRIGTTTDYKRYCHVGSSNQEPAVTDNALLSWIAVSSTSEPEYIGGGLITTPIRYLYSQERHTFNEGVAQGNIQEIGIGWETTNQSLFSRSLIRDEFGDPTSITVLANEILRVTYEIRFYIPEYDAEGTVMVDDVLNNWTSRAACSDIAATSHQGNSGWMMSHAGYHSTGYISIYFSSLNTFKPQDEYLSTGSSSSTAGSSLTIASYINGTYYRQASILRDLNDSNHEIRRVALRFGWGSWQFILDPGFTKTELMRVTFTFRHSWGREDNEPTTTTVEELTTTTV